MKSVIYLLKQYKFYCEEGTVIGFTYNEDYAKRWKEKGIGRGYEEIKEILKCN